MTICYGQFGTSVVHVLSMADWVQNITIFYNIITNLNKMRM